MQQRSLRPPGEAAASAPAVSGQKQQQSRGSPQLSQRLPALCSSAAACSSARRCLPLGAGLPARWLGSMSRASSAAASCARRGVGGLGLGLGLGLGVRPRVRLRVRVVVRVGLRITVWDSSSPGGGGQRAVAKGCGRGAGGCRRAPRGSCASRWRLQPHVAGSATLCV